ncbi:MAG: nitroreductase family protein [Candidatus Caldarchaeum sp.]|nr:nitroreductase family protein [Candidatus Caldarchaeum sp.]MDW8359044.1 nitroreductase family protein [Candidatus Caldarchaeum sp.]
MVHEDVLKVILSKRETRIYADKPVPDELVFKVLEAGRLAGSAKNRQPWQLILIRDKKNLQELSRFGNYAHHLPHASFAVVVLVPDKYVHDRFDAGRAAQNMMLAAHALGIGSCPITLQDEEGAKKFLNVPQDLKTVVCIAFGYSAEEKRKGKVARKQLDEILHFEKYGNVGMMT